MAQNIIRGDKKYLWGGEQYDKAISQQDATEDSFWIRFYANADDKCLRVAGDYYETKRQLARMLNYDEYGKYFGKDLPADRYRKDVLWQIERKGAFIDKCLYVSSFEEDETCSLACAQLNRSRRLLSFSHDDMGKVTVDLLDKAVCHWKAKHLEETQIS